MRSQSLLFLLLTLLLAGCTAVHYESPEFEDRTRDHRTVAVLPFEIIFTGRVPADLSLKEVAAIEEAESVAFQWELYNRLLHQSSRHRKHPITIKFQSVETTNDLLRQHGIGVRESWVVPSRDLASVLEVDAVIRTTVRKTRYLPGLASYAIDLGIHVLNQETAGKAAPWIPVGAARTYDIEADSELAEEGSGDVLWKVAVQRTADWRSPANEVIEGITRKLAKKFPYRP